MKNLLLKTGYFLDNEWLDKYVDLLSKQTNIGYVEKHHFIPVSIYKYLYKCKTRYEAEKLADQDANNFLVKLSFVDHCKAHLYLYNCTRDEIKHSNEVAFKTMVEDKVKIKNSDLTKEEEQLLINWKNQILVNSDWYWSVQEEQWLKENYNKLPKAEIAKHLGRSIKAVTNKAKYLDITEQNNWTTDEIAWLKENRSKYSLQECANKLGRSKKALIAFCLKQNIQAIPNWTAAEVDWLKSHYKEKTLKECAEHLDRTRNAVQQKLNDLGLSKNKKWSSEEDNFIKENYTKLSAKEIAKKLNCRERQIMERARTLDIRKFRRL